MQLRWSCGWLTGTIALSLLAIGLPVKAQVIPDETLGNERSSVRRETIRGIDSDRIDGGARRC